MTIEGGNNIVEKVRKLKVERLEPENDGYPVYEDVLDSLSES